MGYLNKNTSALLDIKLTDSGRQSMSQGKFDISYFQIGDSEVCYNCDNSNENTNQFIFESSYNQQNSSPIPERTKLSIKYPLFINSNSDNTFGIPMNQSQTDSVYNTATPRGFFYGNIGSIFNNLQLGSDYCVNSSYRSTISNFNGTDTITLVLLPAGQTNALGTIEPGNFVTFFFRGDISPVTNNQPILTYKVLLVTYGESTVTVKLDRKLPLLSTFTDLVSDVRAIFYPSGLVPFYDYETPDGYYTTNNYDYETTCDSNGEDVKIWNMNIPWRESVAGTFGSSTKGFENYGSVDYLSTMQYLGYYSSEGQTNSSPTYYVDSLGQRNVVESDHQKCISIIHYSNNTIDNFYGEKFGLRIPENNDIDTGSAKNFKIEVPTLMWHKNKNATLGETFYVDPPGFEDKQLFTIQEMNSNKSAFMSDPGLRYYDLWDVHANSDGFPNRVGKVWPDLKVITFDDEEIVASMNYKSNRNWTLPAPQLGLVAPNTFNNVESAQNGVLNGTGETMWVTYRFKSNNFTDSLHCNYYTYVSGNSSDCPPFSSNITLKFGEEFNFLVSLTQATSVNGFFGENIEIIAQKTVTGQKPLPNGWKKIDVTNQIQNYNNLSLTQENLTSTTFQITRVLYDNAPSYNIGTDLGLPTLGSSDSQLNFGDEYYFYGTLKTDIQATIYVMNFACILGGSQFMRSSNPTSDSSTIPEVTEVGLYNSNKDLMVIAKLQSPELRNGVQQYSIKLDF